MREDVSQPEPAARPLISARIAYPARLQLLRRFEAPPVRASFECGHKMRPFRNRSDMRELSSRFHIQAVAHLCSAFEVSERRRRVRW